MSAAPRLARRARQVGTLVGLCLLSALLSILSPHFLSVSNLRNVLEQTAINAVVAVGMTFVVISGGIDVAAKVEIYEEMNRLTARGAGILMVSSELPELLGMSDRILVMREGRIVVELDALGATQEQVLRAALGQTA